MRVFKENFRLCLISNLLVAVIFLQSFSLANAEDIRSSLNLKMKYLSRNQAVISKNLANSNTPQYKALEVAAPKYKFGGGLAMATTSPMHISSINGNNGSFKTTKQKDAYETAPNGNNVSIEEQVVKMSENDLQTQATAGILKKMSSLMNVARGDR